MPGDQEWGSAMILALMQGVKTKHMWDSSRSLKNPKTTHPSLMSAAETHVYTNSWTKESPFSSECDYAPFFL